ncbi:ufm1-specific protease 2-like isoform X2 [Artemia franciscana]|uniref:Probable Ufm1-specific protease 2 n=1 Tax=Artemia franciscana TaxID=6661 RepID=A0AA88HTL8_ARTSF|nr:hypothetical protein QYM36_010518 [Artemia franciscana]
MKNVKFLSKESFERASSAEEGYHFIGSLLPNLGGIPEVTVVTSMKIGDEGEENSPIFDLETLSCLPSGLTVVGHSTKSKEGLPDQIDKALVLKNEAEYTEHHLKKDELNQPGNYEIAPNNLLLVRVQGKYPVCLFASFLRSYDLEDLKPFDVSDFAFHLKKSKCYILKNNIVTPSSCSTFGDLLKQVDKNEVLSKGRRHREVSANFEFRANVSCSSLKSELSNSFDSAQWKTQLPSPTILYKSEPDTIVISGMVDIDYLAYISSSSKIEEIFDCLSSGIWKQLHQTYCYAADRFSNGLRLNVLPKRFHFKPRCLGHFVSTVAIDGEPEKNREEERKALHEMFSIPLTEPFFRLGSRYFFSDSSVPSGCLLNVHEHGASNMLGGDVGLVQGTYAYHHYMQDNFDDNGWGCAYRSLQTICSWYRHQGYTELPIPSHKDIQKILCDIGDKSASFVGSRQWIGSLEVSYVLKTLLDVESGILSVSSGADMDTIARELIVHFENVGTPVMIGGGVLAHTILGVDYVPLSGRCAFLILDPHYTGSEDINTIIGRGWCGWKTSEFWNKNSFYNLCLPKKPEMF